MNKKKIVVQAVICMAILGAVKADFVAKIPNSDAILTMASADYSTEEIFEESKGLWNKVKKLPEMVSSIVDEANKLNLYGEPLQSAGGEIKQVYATRGGNVEKSGLSSEYGLYVIIDHGDAKTVYGNMNKINSVAGERVKKGDIIGSYDSSCGKDFYYTVKE